MASLGPDGLPEPRVVVDPELPEDQRRRLADLAPLHTPAALPERRRFRVSGGGPYLPPDRFHARRARRAVIAGGAGTAVFMAAHGTVNPADLWLTPEVSGIATVLGWAHDVVLAVALAALLLSVLWWLNALRTGFGVRVRIGEPYQVRQLRLAQGRYVAPGDLDAESCRLLARAQRAIGAVLDSEVNRAGVLDRVHNEVALPHQEWEIAKALRGLSRLRAGEHAAGADAAAQAVKKVTEHVLALEEYAEQVRAADAAYHVAALDGQAGGQVDELTGQARDTARALEHGARRLSELDGG